jgi:S1-C subfamily serine protease
MLRLVLILWFGFALLGCGDQSVSDDDWEKTISRVSNGIVNIQMDVPVSFDGKYNSTSQATGFVVDKSMGLVLTNRHVVTPGPVTARAIFLNNEELELTPVYFDPVHDFGFFRYDPAALEHLDVYEFKLVPERAQLGREIRVIGNDAGQKISILAGTISRLDAPAPGYGIWNYNDFNTFYIQAASGTSGGSSGSPVIAANGDVLALNAGAQNNAATAFYLPLDRVVRAFNKIVSSEQIARGTLQTEFRQKSYAELERLGLDSETEAQTRQDYPGINGLLVVESRLERDDSEILDVGDILYSVAGKRIVNFVELEASLDEHVGASIAVEYIRQGKRQMANLLVDDLHSLTPSAYIGHNAGVLHNLSYQQARHFNQASKGVYLAGSPRGFEAAGIPRHSVVVEVNGEALNSIEEFAEILENTAERERMQLRYYTTSEPNVLSYAVVEIERRWFDDVICERDDELGYWPCKTIEAPAQKKSEPLDFTAIARDYRNSAVNKLAPSVVSVHVEMPFPLHGITSAHQGRQGFGLVVDAEKGWILVDRSTVPTTLADIKVLFFNTIEIDATVEYIHPLHNLALVSYDTELVKKLGIRSAALSSKSPQDSEKYLQVSLGNSGLEYREVTVDRVDALSLSVPNVPRYRDANMDVVYLEQYRNGVDGVLANSKGEVSAFWASFEDQGSKNSTWRYRGIGQEYIHQLIALAEGEIELRSAEVELVQLSAVDIIEQGLPPEWLQRYQTSSGYDDRFMVVNFISSGSPNRDTLKRGDILLSLGGSEVNSYWDYEQLIQAPSVATKILRNGQVVDVELKTIEMSGEDVSEVLLWSGAFIHPPHRAVQMQRGVPAEGLWVSFYYWGSPANRYGLGALNRIVEVDGKEINSIDDFVEAVKDKQHQDSVRVAVRNMQDLPAMLTMKVDEHYWPSYTIEKTDSGFKKQSF